jgi:23S rRNA pseudouridine1911/1915/1917 synthase
VGPQVEVVAEPVPGMRIVHDDDDIVVVDKPVGVAAHPSVGWTGPNVVGGLAAAGYRISTSGASERQGIVSRARRRHLRAHGRRQERVRLQPAQAGLQEPARSTRPTTRSSRGCPTRWSGTIDAPIGRHPGTTTSSPSWRRASPRSPTTRSSRPSGGLAAGGQARDRAHPSDPGAHGRAARHPCCGDPLYGADPKLAARLGLERQWLHAVGLGFEHPGTGEWVTFTSPYPADLEHALDVLGRRPTLPRVCRGRPDSGLAPQHTGVDGDQGPRQAARHAEGCRRAA